MKCPHCGESLPTVPPRRFLNDKMVHEVAASVCQAYGIGICDLFGPDRRHRIVAARWEVWRIFREQGYSFPEIGRAVGNRDHSSVYNAFKNNWVPPTIKRERAALAAIEARLG